MRTSHLELLKATMHEPIENMDVLNERLSGAEFMGLGVNSCRDNSCGNNRKVNRKCLENST